ncbi:hypothetical protein HPP92_028357 [Vanilla planifolia]|uniref:Uncharacterized protein n=1 Tax=Vanilla planifolia TaxID=51239 RepID=A0A835P864_VANPL|nr:hypothetical protein HPP92_028357 [Vanilla planifolia]
MADDEAGWCQGSKPSGIIAGVDEGRMQVEAKDELETIDAEEVIDKVNDIGAKDGNREDAVQSMEIDEKKRI